MLYFRYAASLSGEDASLPNGILSQGEQPELLMVPGRPAPSMTAPHTFNYREAWNVSSTLTRLHGTLVTQKAMGKRERASERASEREF